MNPLNVIIEGRHESYIGDRLLKSIIDPYLTIRNYKITVDI
jgi:hypothetical protein